MRRHPRGRRTGIFTRPVVSLMSIGGVWSAVVNLAVFTGALNSGLPVEKAMNITFVSLVFIQFLKAYNYRSDRLSVFRRPFANKWLNLAILWELLLLYRVVSLPFLEKAFGTSSLSLTEWALLAAAAFTVVPVIETGKWLERHGRFGKMD